MRRRTLKNDLLLRALLREPTPRRPIWLMRQAGRYLPEYRATRARAGGFLEMCTNPEIACEITLQPVDRYPLDAAILFSDILTIPHAMNLGLEFEAGEGPTVRAPGADCRRYRQARRAGSGAGIEVRDRRRGAGAPRVGRPRTARSALPAAHGLWRRTWWKAAAAKPSA